MEARGLHFPSHITGKEEVELTRFHPWGKRGCFMDSRSDGDVSYYVGAIRPFRDGAEY